MPHPARQNGYPALAWVESPLQLLSAAEWAHRHLVATGEPTRIAYRISDPQVVTTAETLSRMRAPFARYEPYYGIPWVALAKARHWAIGDPLSGQFRLAVNVLPTPRRLSVLDDGSMVVHAMRAMAGESSYARPGQEESRGKALLGELAGAKLRALGSRRGLELFTAFDAAHPAAERVGARIVENDFGWLRDAARRGDSPRIPLPGSRLALGSARVVDGLLRESRYLEWVRDLAREAPLGYLPHRRENPDLLGAVAALSGVTVISTGLPVELVLAAAREPLELHTLPSSTTTTLRAVLAGSGSVIRAARLPRESPRPDPRGREHEVSA